MTTDPLTKVKPGAVVPESDLGGVPRAVFVAGITAERLELLAAPTPEMEIKQRPVYLHGKPTGKMLSYVDARYVQDLLDNVIGPAFWQDRYEDTSNGVRCGIGILVANEWVWKWDVGIPSNIEPVKGAHSDAFKRAAVKWGIARDLYDDREDETAAVPSEGSIRESVGLREGRYAEGESVVHAGTFDGAPTGVALDPETTPWTCPIHGEVKIVPAGTSKKPPYRAYPAFYACPERDCDEKGPRA